MCHPAFAILKKAMLYHVVTVQMIITNLQGEGKMLHLRLHQCLCDFIPWCACLRLSHCILNDAAEVSYL